MLVELKFGPGETARFEFEAPDLGAFVSGQI